MKYKEELTKMVKTLKALKLFYFDYYFEKDEAEKGRDLDSLRYINYINSEFINVETTNDISYSQKINNAKIIIDNLNSNINFKAKFIYGKLKPHYSFEYEKKSAHDKFITSIFELKNEKILTTSLDCSIKIWEEKDSQLNELKTITERCGCILSDLKIDNDKILTSNNSNNGIYYWSPNPYEGYVIEQLMSLHKMVICMEQLENGNLVTSGYDNKIIVWQKRIEGFYEGKETIQEAYVVKKIYRR